MSTLKYASVDNEDVLLNLFSKLNQLYEDTENSVYTEIGIFGGAPVSLLFNKDVKDYDIFMSKDLFQMLIDLGLLRQNNDSSIDLLGEGYVARLKSNRYYQATVFSSGKKELIVIDYKNKVIPYGQWVTEGFDMNICKMELVIDNFITGSSRVVATDLALKDYDNKTITCCNRYSKWAERFGNRGAAINRIKKYMDKTGFNHIITNPSMIGGCDE